jgi:CMP-N-acetylneuraminic acid synthetase
LKTIALIIAKGESTRLPNKNKLPFCGLPLFAWSVIQAVNSHLVDETYLSTEDAEIAEIGEKYGATIIHRIIADKDESGGSVFKRHTRELTEMFPSIEEVVNLLPTGVLRKPDDIDNMIKMRRKVDAIRIIGAWIRNETMIYKILNVYTCRGVIFDKLHRHAEEIGATNVAHIDYPLKQCDNMIRFDKQIDPNLNEIVTALGENIISFYPMESWQRFDINSKDEFILAEMVMKHYILKDKGRKVYFEYGNI